MTQFVIRPRFVRRSKKTKQELLERFSLAFKEPRDHIRGYVVDHHVYLKVDSENQHFWSPQLALELVEDEEGVDIKALFGPSPQVWLMYIFIYSLLGFLAFVVLIVGGSRWNLGMSAGILWFVPVLAILIVLAFLTAKTGQKLGHDQMHELYDFLMDTVGEVEAVEGTQ